MPAPYRWKPFVDLPDSAGDLTSGELEALSLVWEEQRQFLLRSSALDEFNQRLQREWSIETGIIEGVYTLDRGITQTLIQRGIDASLIPHDSTNRDPTMVATLIQDHYEALEGMFAFVKGDRELTVGYVKELHAALLRHQENYTVVDQLGTVFDKELEKGLYKTSPNNPTRPNGSIHEYCPPEQVSSEMDRMIVLHQVNTRAGTPLEVEAAWLHHVFTQIHPFEDGNGRVARALASLVFLKAGWFPLVVTRDDRQAYIEALEQADQGDLKPLVSLFTQIQKRNVVQAIELASEVKPAQTVDEAVAAARAKLIAEGRIIPKEWNQVKVTAQHLTNVALTRLNEVAVRLRAEIGSVRGGYNFSVQGATMDVPWLHNFQAQLRYMPNPKLYHVTAQLTLTTERTASLLVSIHGLGKEFRGLLAASAFLLGADEGAVVVVSDDFLQLNYREDKEKAQERFVPWLESAIVKGLTLWREQL